MGIRIHTTRALFLLVVVCFLGTLAIAENVGTLSAEVPEQQERQFEVTEIPAAVPNSDRRIKESLTINSEMLHGFAMADLQAAATQQIAMISGAVDPLKHVSKSGYGEYQIEAGDVVEFLSFDDELLSREVTVRYDGDISLPMVPDVSVTGLTRGQAEEAIRVAYSVIFREPAISLTVTSPESKTYTVMGDVETPGRYPYSRATSLTQALSLAGGLSARSSGGSGGSGFIGITGQITKAFVIRNVDGERRVFAHDLRGMGKPGAYEGDSPVYYGDVIYVPEGVNLIYLLGESRSPVIVELTEGMTLLQMLALSGGYDSSTARLKEVVLLREVDEDNTEVHLINVRAILKGGGNDVRMLPGDIVYIPRKRLVRLEEFVRRFTGTLSPLLGLYGQAIDAFFAYDLNDESLKALENSNSVVLPVP